MPVVTLQATAPVDNGITPDALRALYGVGDTQCQSTTSKQAALGFDQEYILPADVAVRCLQAIHFSRMQCAIK